MFNTFISALIAATATASGGATSYNYEQQGADWGTLRVEGSNDLAYPDCNGQQQSPIDLAYAVETGSQVLAIELDNQYEDYESVTMSKAGGGVKVNLGVSGSLGNGTMDLTRVDEMSEWVPLQFHFHAPSEHTVNGRHMDLEMHIVHLTPDMELGAVLGIFFDTQEGGDGENTFINQMKGLATQESVTGPLSLKGWLQSLNTEDFWSYDGSLTTPPCTEGVRWSNLKTVQPISAEQLEMFNNVWKDSRDWSAQNGIRGNYREVQPLNRRELYFAD